MVIDCRDLDCAARFWTAALGYVAEDEVAEDEVAEDEVAEDEVAEEASGGTYRSLRPRDGAGIEILLQRTADIKVAKNRLHLDLRTRDLTAEVRRVTDLGATVLTGVPVRENGWAWHILADPDGNEFCVLQPPDGYWTGP